MHLIQHPHLVSGGNPFIAAVGIGATTFLGGVSILQGVDWLGNKGKGWGEGLYYHNHKNELGYMNYEKTPTGYKGYY
jgi:hypothetical protein